MSRVRGQDTKPEMAVRRLVHGMGYRYRLHGKDIPGCPDLVFPSRGKVIFVHGCFWHRHSESSCKLARLPKSRLDFWLPKLTANATRDVRNQRKLEEMGWSWMIVWECEMNDRGLLELKIKSFLAP
jgi:DNA mismatch endonuclease (patch repair protein)